MRAAWIVVAAAAFGLAGCEKLARNMYDGAKLRPDAARPEQPGAGTSTWTPPEGTVEHSRGVVAMTSGGRRGAEGEARRLAAERALALPDVTPSMLARGHERFDIYCAPCHSVRGDGDGFIARRVFPHPPPYGEARLRAAADRHFYDVITQGYGVMYAYGDRVAPEDRWAIVAWIRELQRRAPQRLARGPA